MSWAWRIRSRRACRTSTTGSWKVSWPCPPPSSWIGRARSRSCWMRSGAGCHGRSGTARRWASPFPWPRGCASGRATSSASASRTSGCSGPPSRRCGAPSRPDAVTGRGPGPSSCSRASAPIGARGSSHERHAATRRRSRAALGRHRPLGGPASRRGPRALALPGPALLPDLARHLGPLQADRPGLSLGDSSALSHHGRVRDLSGPTRRHAKRRCSLSRVLVSRALALDVLLGRGHPGGDECGRQRSPPHARLLSARARAAVGDLLCPRGLRHRLARPRRPHGLVRHSAGAHRRAPGAPGRPNRAGGHGDRHVAGRPQCPLPGRAVRHPVRDAALDVRHPGGLSDEPRAGGLAAALRPQSHDGHHRGVPGRRAGDGARLEQPGHLRSERGRAGRARRLAVPPHGTELRGSGLVMRGLAVRVQGLSKRYCIGDAAPGPGHLRDALVDMLAAPFRRLGRPRAAAPEEFWALRDVSFDVPQGEVLGIIGRNGAGKSTALKIISRITPPTAGRVELYGRIGSLLEVGTGFHGDLTGRENIYLNGTILGMRKWEIDRKFDEIVAFAGVEAFIDTPVKRYSSGMYMRLAFAVAAHLDTEILLVDEVLAVGDLEFQRKCLGKMDEVARTGRTVLFVSHNMAVMRRLCDRGILLDRGQMVASGPMDTVADLYVRPDPAGEARARFDPRDRHGVGWAQVTDARIVDDQGGPAKGIPCDADLLIELSIEVTDGMPAGTSLRG